MDGLLGAPARSGRAPRFVEAARCPWDLAAEGAPPAGRTVRCGFVLVPEERTNPGGPTLRLAVLVAQRHPRPASDAIITLQGGPGNTSAVGDLTPFLGAGRDVIVFDQRGVGKSVPALNCAPVGNRDPLTAAHDDQALLAGCRDRLVRQGVRLDGYTIREDAADVDAIRQALGYRQLDLYGLSYGTELALAVMRGFPRTVRSAVLDSVLPAQTDVVADIPANMQRALQQVFGACAADAWCRRTFPDLRDAFSQLVASLDARPAAIHTGAGILHLGGAQLVRLLYGLLLSSPQQAPAVIYGVKHRDYGPLTRAIDAEAAPSDATAWVMSWSIVCSDGNFGTHARVRDRSRSLWPELRGIVAGAQAVVTLCQGWPVRKAAAASVGPVTSAIPTLVLEGRLDAITPPAYGRAAARTLAHSFYLEFPDRGHIVRGDACSYAIIAAFLARPAARPGSRCLAGLAVNFAAGASNRGGRRPGRYRAVLAPGGPPVSGCRACAPPHPQAVAGAACLGQLARGRGETAARGRPIGASRVAARHPGTAGRGGAARQPRAGRRGAALHENRRRCRSAHAQARWCVGAATSDLPGQRARKAARPGYGCGDGPARYMRPCRPDPRPRVPTPLQLKPCAPRSFGALHKAARPRPTFRQRAHLIVGSASSRAPRGRSVCLKTGGSGHERWAQRPQGRRTMDGYDFSGDSGSSDPGFQQFDDVINGNDSASYDGLSSVQSFDDILTDNQGYGWDTTSSDGGTVWATGDSGTDGSDFGY